MIIRSTNTTELVAIDIDIHLEAESIRRFRREYAYLDDVRNKQLCPTIASVIDGIIKEIDEQIRNKCR